jgi:hypothetical protein
MNFFQISVVIQLITEVQFYVRDVFTIYDVVRSLQ